MTIFDELLPDLPAATGRRAVFAGQVSDPSHDRWARIEWLVGDYHFARQVSFIVQGPTRGLGVLPQGAMLSDAVLADGTRRQFGELGLLYVAGRSAIRMR